MILSEMQFADATPIESYGPGFFRIKGQLFEGPTLFCKEQAISWGGYEDIDALLALKGSVDVIFIGTGSSITHIPAPLRKAMDEAGIGVEPMSSPSACRTYNVLLSEGRRVAAALLPTK